jgi:peptidoglycan hydrolase CwlO-like protein
MEDTEREQLQETIDSLKADIWTLNETIESKDERITELQDSISEIYSIARRV